MTLQQGDRIRLAGFVLIVLLAIVSAVGWAVTANTDALANGERIKDHETRIRSVEQVMPMINEKLANIERMVREDKKK